MSNPIPRNWICYWNPTHSRSLIAALIMQNHHSFFSLLLFFVQANNCIKSTNFYLKFVDKMQKHGDNKQAVRSKAGWNKFYICLIKSGGGNGPVKPGNLFWTQGAKSDGVWSTDEVLTSFIRLRRPVGFFLLSETENTLQLHYIFWKVEKSSWQDVCLLPNP